MRNGVKENMGNPNTHVGKVICGYWEIVESIKINNSRCYKYKLRNIYNKQELVIGGTTLRKILNGKTSVSKIIARKLRKNKGN